MSKKADSEIEQLLIDHFKPQTATDWIELQKIFSLPLADRIKWAYQATTGKDFKECKEKVQHIEIYKGTLTDLVSTMPDFLGIRKVTATIDEASALAEELVKANELALIEFDGHPYVLICLDALVNHYRSLHN